MAPLPYVNVFVILFLLVVHGRGSQDLPLTQIPYDLYHSSDSLLKEVRELVGRHPDVLTMETMQASNKGYSAEIMVVTYSNVKRGKLNNTELRVLLSFGQHGREMITSEVALRLLYIFSGEHAMFNINPFSRYSAMENLVVKVVPMENPNGRKLVESGDLCDRRNGCVFYVTS